MRFGGIKGESCAGEVSRTYVHIAHGLGMGFSVARLHAGRGVLHGGGGGGEVEVKEVLGEMATD